MKAKSKGFTLLELLLCLLIASLLTWGVTSLTAGVQRKKLTAVSVQISRNLVFSRQLVIARQSSLSLCIANIKGECGQPPFYQIQVFDSQGTLFSEALSSPIDIDSRWPQWQFRTDGSLVTWGSITLCSGTQGVSLIINRLGRTRQATISC